MAIKDIIAPGIGFSPGSVEYIVTRGFDIGAVVIVNYIVDDEFDVEIVRSESFNLTINRTDAFNLGIVRSESGDSNLS
jgi:hypothetical protein